MPCSSCKTLQATSENIPASGRVVLLHRRTLGTSDKRILSVTISPHRSCIAARESEQRSGLVTIAALWRVRIVRALHEALGTLY